MGQKKMTSKIKGEVVLRLLQGEELELLSREYGVTIAELSEWRERFIAGGINNFKRKPEDAKLSAAERKIGQLQMELELIKKKNEIIAKLKKK